MHWKGCGSGCGLIWDTVPIFIWSDRGGTPSTIRISIFCEFVWSHLPSSLFFFLWRCDPTRAMASSFLRFIDITQRRTTVCRTPLDEWSARRRDLYLTTHNTHNRQTSVPPVGFEPTISAGERPQTYVLDRAATETGSLVFLQDINIAILTLHGRAGGEVKVKVRVSLNCTKHFSLFTSPLEWGEWWASRSGPFKSSERVEMCIGQDCVLEGMISYPCRESSAERCTWSQYLSLRWH